MFKTSKMLIVKTIPVLGEMGLEKENVYIS